VIIPKLALRNLLGAGLRTWLNVVVLSFAFVVIIWTQGLYQGMNDQAERASVDAILGGGQYWQENYDPLDVLSLEDAHAVIPEELRQPFSLSKVPSIPKAASSRSSSRESIRIRHCFPYRLGS
jgi:hypothetical protein